MENRQQRSNGYQGRKNSGNSRNRNNRPAQAERPQRRKRVSVDRDVEVVVVSNTTNRVFYENPRLSIVIDLFRIGDTEYLTVGDLRTILNSNRKMLEGFELIISEVMDDRYTVEDVLVFLGLDSKYDEYYSLAGKKGDGRIAESIDIKQFVLNAPDHKFVSVMESMNDKLRSRVIETAVVLFKLKQFKDFNKMEVIEQYVNEDLFADARETEIDSEIDI